MVPRENKNNAYAKFGGRNKEYYGIFRTGLLSKFSISSPNGSLDSIPIFNTFRVQSTHFMVTKTINLQGIYPRQNLFTCEIIYVQVERIEILIRRGLISLQFYLSL